MARMSQLRERHKSLTKQLSDIKYIEKKIQVRKSIECMKNHPQLEFQYQNNIVICFYLFNLIGIKEKVSKIFTNAF